MNAPENDLPPLPPRPRDAHKGTFGTVLVIGGCDDPQRLMLGAPALCALAAARTGCGLVRIAAPASILPEILTIVPGATGVPLQPNGRELFSSSAAAERLTQHVHEARCLAVGPGWGIGFERQQLLVWLLGREDTPIVLDADGINNLAQLPDFAGDIRAPVILTPHPGELQRLAIALSITHEDRAQAAQQIACRLGCILVLKGATTCITDGQRTFTEGGPNPALATGGTGDVLTGIIASLIAQHWNNSALDLVALARWGVRLHARAAARWAQSHGSGGLLATDLCDLLPDVLHEWQTSAGGQTR